MLINWFLYIISLPIRIFEFSARWGNKTTEMDVLNALHPTEWKTTLEIAAEISKRKKEGKFVQVSTWVDCYRILFHLVDVGWASERKRGQGPYSEFIITGDGIKKRYDEQGTASEPVRKTADETA